MHDAEKLFEAACRIAADNPDFQEVRGPGDGDRATAHFLQSIHERFGARHAEKKLCGENALTVDFYFADEATIVEVALGLHNPASEFEKDILKALVAKKHGARVERLLFIARPGGRKKCEQPGRAAICEWAREVHGLKIEVRDLPGEPRKRTRRRIRQPQPKA